MRSFSLRGVLRNERTSLYSMVFLANLGWGVMSPVLANIQSDFGVSVAEVALANSAFGFARLFLDLPIGILVDRIDQRLVRLAGIVTLALGAVLCAIAGAFWVLVMGRLLNGVGAAIIQVSNLVWVTQSSSDERRGRHLGINQAIMQLGASLSPIAGGALAGLSSWRASFWFAAAMSLLGFLPLFLGSSKWTERVRKVSRRGEARPAPAQPGAARSTVSALFVANLVTFVLFFSVGGFQNTVIPLYGAEILRLTPEAIGLALGLSTVLRFFMSLLGGELSDRFGRRVILIPGLAVMGIGALLLNRATNLPTYWLAIVVLSIGRFGNNVPATVLADHATPDRWGFLMGLNRMIGDLGTVLGPIAMGLILEHVGYGPATVASAALVWLGAFSVVVGVGEVRHRRPVMGQVRDWLQGRKETAP